MQTIMIVARDDRFDDRSFLVHSRHLTCDYADNFDGYPVY